MSSLPSSYDSSLPASLRGEAVRSALKSDRGTCLDFTSPITPNLNVGMVKVTGETVKFLNNKLSNTFPKRIDGEEILIGQNIKLQYGKLKEAGLLSSKGRIIDKIAVLSFVDENNNLEAYLVTTPGHSGSILFNRLDPFIFPLDGIKLQDMCPSGNEGSYDGARIFTILSTKLKTVQTSIQNNIIPLLTKWGFDSGLFKFPNDGSGECLKYEASQNGHEIELLIFEQTYLPNVACTGYTIVINSKEVGQVGNHIGSQIWNKLVDANNFEGPVELGPLEYETLRIEAGVPGFGYEMVGGVKDSESIGFNKASPLELYLDHLIDTEKGCYQGMEGISAQLNNKRGIPRTLYSVIFPNEDNFFDDQVDEEEFSNHKDRLSNKTKRPKVGDELFVLGSNEKIKVGVLTSVAEKDGTSCSETVAMALIRRSDPILKKMQEMGLDLDITPDMFEDDPFWSDSYEFSLEGSGIINPPPMDKLDGLEVVLGGTYTQGYLRSLPHRRLRKGQNLFNGNELDDLNEETGSVMGFIPQDEETLVEKSDSSQPMSSLNTQKREEGPQLVDAEVNSISEEQRKAKKMELLKQRADEALKKKKAIKENRTESGSVETSIKINNTGGAETEASRKEEKMKLLKQKAEEAMARRRQKQDSKNV